MDYQQELELKIAEAKAEEKRCRDNAAGIHDSKFVITALIGFALIYAAIMCCITTNATARIWSYVLFTVGPVIFLIGLIGAIIQDARRQSSLHHAQEAHEKIVLSESMIQSQEKETPKLP
jgi:hypothetical protein